MNHYHFHIEGDSSIIINACINRRRLSSHLKYILNQTWKILDSFQEVCISQMLREGNKVGDFLSNLGCDGLSISSLHLMFIIEQHDDLKSLIVEDMETYHHETH